MKWLWLGVVVACSSAPAPTAQKEGGGALVRKPDIVVDAAPGSTQRWFAGDVHTHVSPPDDPTDVTLSIATIAKGARDAKLVFVVLTPHLWPSRIGAAFRKEWRTLADTARADKSLVLIPGIEWSTYEGHFTIAGVEIDQITSTDLINVARDKGAFISVNHPFAVPTKIPGIRVSHYDMSYRVWTEGKQGFTAIDGVEVWNAPLALANFVVRPGGASGEQRAWLAADAQVRKTKKPLVAVGGTDNHNTLVQPTTWVLADAATESSILDGLRAGRTCVGGPEAGSFRANGVGIGGVVRASSITLTWDGTARVFVDGVDRGEHDRQFVHTADASPHTYRIEIGASRSGFIYSNL